MSNRKYTLEQFKQAVQESNSIAQTLTKLGLACKGGNYQSFNKYVKENNIDTSHFTGQRWNKGQTLGPKRDIQDYLSNKQTITSYKLKNRLIREKLLLPQCNICKNTTWQNMPIALELHHKDGNSSNNNIENLELLCPNCHAFTDNYRGKNQKRAKA
jgi:hypothetical protein